MPRGGAREGAGRKAGAPTRFNAEARAKAAAGGIMPLDYLLAILRDETKPQETRIDVAKAAAPYVHAKLAAIEHTGADGGPIEMRSSKEQRDAAVSAALRSTDA